jgi:hypothetical protein
VTQSKPDFVDVCAALTTAGVGAESAATVIAWAIKNGVLAAQSRSYVSPPKIVDAPKTS